MINFPVLLSYHVAKSFSLFHVQNVGLVGKSIGQVSGTTWRERLHIWKEILRRDKLAEQIDTTHAKYVVDFDMQEVEKSLRKDVVEKVSETQGSRALWISKRWWHYRPKLPYTYFLSKLDCSEVSTCYLRDFYELHIQIGNDPMHLSLFTFIFSLFMWQNYGKACCNECWKISRIL